MVSKNTILISVNKGIKAELDKLKLHPKLAYNDVVVELLEFWKSNHKSPEPEQKLFTLETSIEYEQNAEETIYIKTDTPELEANLAPLCLFCNAIEANDSTLGKITEHEPSCNAPKTTASTGN